MNATIANGKQTSSVREFDLDSEDPLNSNPGRDLSMQIIQPACFADVRSLVRLSGENVPHVALNTVWEIPWTWSHYQVIRDSTNQIVGAAALLPLGNSLAEIRGLVVANSWRGVGVATRIVKHLLSWADERKMSAVCVTRNPGFFQKFGFQETNPAWLDLQYGQMQILRNASHLVSSPLAPRVSMALAS